MLLIIDTTLFANPQSYQRFHEDRWEATKLMLKALKEKGFTLYTTPAVMKELSRFIPSEELEGLILIKSPDLSKINIPAWVFLEYLKDLRKRFDKGLRIAEEYARENPDESKIKSLREKYRTYVRGGILDSPNDLEVILLALELDGFLVTSDEGMVKMAQLLGSKIIKAENIPFFLSNV